MHLSDTGYVKTIVEYLITTDHHLGHPSPDHQRHVPKNMKNRTNSKSFGTYIL